MTEEIKEILLKYLQNQIANLGSKVDIYTASSKNTKYSHRSVYLVLEKYLREYQKGNDLYRWLIVSGLRGVGKTTLILQLLSSIKTSNIRKIYLSVDEITKQLGVSLSDVLAVYEEILGNTFENLTEPIYLFLDEVQYENDWAVILKTIYDRSKMVFIVATGSAALNLQANADVNRRAICERVYPMSFTEYIKLKMNKFEEKGLAGNLREIVFESQTAEELYWRLKKNQFKVKKYYAGIGRLEIDHYVRVGNMPFMLKMNNIGVAYDQMKKVVDTIISRDIVQLKKFDATTIDAFPRLIYMLTNNDVTSIDRLTNNMNVTDRKTVMSMLEVLELTQMIVRIMPFGNRGKQVRKMSKYLFATPVFRSMYLNMLGSTLSNHEINGKLYEDVVGMYLIRYLARKSLSYSLTYDSSAGGADFILGVKETGKKIIFEVGSGNKSFKQLESTAKKMKDQFAYGLSISMSPLAIDESRRFVNLPLSYFLLM